MTEHNVHVVTQATQTKFPSIKVTQIKGQEPPTPSLHSWMHKSQS